METWIGPVTAVAVAIVAASGAWLTFTISKSSQRNRREDTLQKRVVRLLNYAQRLRATIENLGGDPEPWPDNLFDSEDPK